MSKLNLGEPGSAVSQRRIEEALDRLDRRKEPRAFSVTADFGSAPVTSFSVPVTGLGWLTSGHRIHVNCTSAADLAANLHGCATDLEPGKGFTLRLASSSGLSGSRSISIIAV